jgi:glycosyltransferase involved in cell wall biosynthesis
MNIAIVSSPYISIPPQKYGGTERVIHFLIKGLIELGHTPILFGPGDSTVDCKIIPICEKAIQFGKDNREQAEVEKLVKQIQANTHDLLLNHIHDIDVIHSHGYDLLNFKHLPNVTTLHGQISLSEMEYYEARKELLFCSISKNQQDTFPDLKYLGVVYNGLDPADFDFVEKPDDYVCFLGRFDREKSPHLAIQLALSLGLKIKMGGKVDFQGKDYFDEEIKPYLDNPNVEFLVELDLQEKKQLLGRAKLNLHPTNFREPFGLTVLEAAYCGTPTLAISRGSMPEIIEHERTGFLVEDFNEGYHHVEQCFHMDRKYISERAKMLYNYEKMAKGYVEAYSISINIFQNPESINELLKRQQVL